MSSPNRPASKKPQRRFQFIDNSNIGASNANSTQVRRHVMQEYMREKRWESRAKAEEEVLDFSAQSPPHRKDTRPSSRKSPPKSHARGQAFANASSRVKENVSPDTLIAQIPIFETTQCDTPSSTLTVKPTTQNKISTSEKIENIPRSFAPATQLEPKHPRRAFYLTPQSFASIADISDVPPLTPSSATTSRSDLSPLSLSASPSLLPNTYRSSFSPEPSTLLSAARTDPFNSLPLALSKQDQELFDFYATIMPACSYGFERRHPKAHNWYLSVFIPEAMKSPVAFQNTILVHAANTQAWVRGLTETPLAIEHRARASQVLSEYFQKNPYDTSDAAISSTLSAAALEDFDPRLERRKYAWMHWNAAVKKIRDRGGPASLEQSKSLRMLINWSDYIFSGYNGYGSTFYFDHRLSPQYNDRTEAELIGRRELLQQCEEFIIFLKCSESLALVAANGQNNPMVCKKQPLRYSVFESQQPLHRLLASPNGPRYTKTGQLKQIISRLAALMTMNVAIWEYRYSTTASEKFFDELLQNVKYNDLDQHASVEALLQILLSGSENPDLVHTERPWLVGRLLKVAKRLSRNSWERLNDFLLQCLTLGPTLKPLVETWEDDLRAEIVSAPLVSEVLPLMQP